MWRLFGGMALSRICCTRRVLACPHRVQQMRLSAIPPKRRHTGSVGSPAPSSPSDKRSDKRGVASFAFASEASVSSRAAARREGAPVGVVDSS